MDCNNEILYKRVEIYLCRFLWNFYVFAACKLAL